MTEISNAISDLAYKKYDKIRIAQELLKRGYPTKEIKSALDKSKIGKTNINAIIGILLIVVGLLANLYTKSTYFNNHFRFDFFSQADFMLFNERILKPTITLSMIFLGINLILNRSNVHKLVKVFLFILLGIFTVTITAYYSSLAFVFSLISLMLVFLVELPQRTKNPEIAIIFPYLNKVWKGSAGYIFLLLGTVLVYSADIQFNYVSTGERTSKAVLGILDYILIYSTPIIGLVGLATSLLVSIDFSKFKMAFYALASISAIVLIVCLFHSVFQNLIYGCSILLITSAFMYLKNKKSGIKKNTAIEPQP